MNKKEIQIVTLPDSLSEVDALNQIDELMKSSKNVGFLPMQALKDGLKKSGIIGAVYKEREIIGYLFYYSCGYNKSKFHIVHLCVSKEYRGQGIPRLLFDKLKSSVGSGTEIFLNCREDYRTASHMWGRFGFKPLYERRGRGENETTIVRWRYPLKEDDQLNIFQSKVSDSALDVVIDANIFYDYTDNRGVSVSLFADYLEGLVEIWLTDELLNEIMRNENRDVRESHRQEFNNFPFIEEIEEKTKKYQKILSGILPDSTPRELSDIKHLSIVAASDKNIFVTSDKKLLSKKAKIFAHTSVEVMDAETAIIKILENQRSDYSDQSLVSGDLKWCRASSAALEKFKFNDFTVSGERLHELKKQVKRYCAQPQYSCQILSNRNENVCIRVREFENDNKTVIIHMVRINNKKSNKLYYDFAVDNTIGKALKYGDDTVRFTKNIDVRLAESLVEAGFLESATHYNKILIRNCMNNTGEYKELLAKQLPAKTINDNSHRLSDLCGPASILGDNIQYFIVPIKPHYAMNLYNYFSAKADLFGAENEILMRRENVYYKKNSSSSKLRVGTSRILWYESANPLTMQEGRITAVSHLKSIEVGKPKELFKKYKKFGILNWGEIYSLCSHNVDNKLMAINFTKTYLFTRCVERRCLERLGFKSNSFQGTRSVCEDKFAKIIHLGYN